jgi:glutamate 5-kinase
MNMKLNPRKLLRIPKKSLVIKLSSLAVTTEDGNINKNQLKAIIHDISTLIQDYGFNIVLVSSGAINAGKNLVPLSKNQDISYLQACASVGQPVLMNAMQKELSKYQLQIAQILLTHEDLKSKKRSLNIRGTLLELINTKDGQKCIPIINENDAVSFDEITVGDNDQLSAMISELLGIKTLLMLSTPNGLYDKDPKIADAKQISLIKFDDHFQGLELISKSNAGRGGMKTKLQAVRKLTPLGHDVIISSFKNKNPILSPLTQEIGSLFLGAPLGPEKKKHSWLITRLKNDCSISIDEGAKRALLKNASLLPIGILQTNGNFQRGDCIEILFKNKRVGIGISEYSNSNIEKIKQLKSTQLVDALPLAHSKVVIHKNNLLLIK